MLIAFPIAILVLALASQIALPLPFSPVPLTLQSLAVLLVGATLGPWRGAVAVLLWLLLAAAGLPLLSSGSSGLGGPTAGYLFAMPAAAALAGWRPGLAGWRPGLAAMLAAHALILAAGTLWLAAGIGLPRAMDAGLWPFLPGALIKSLVAVWVAPHLRCKKSSANTIS